MSNLKNNLPSWARTAATRRAFLGGTAGLTGLGALGWSPRARAAQPNQRSFLFFWAGGGWDTTAVLDPHFEVDGVDMDEETELGSAGRLRWTSGADREDVDRYFLRWGGRTAIINGVDAHTVGHLSGTQFMLTGTSASGYADWGTLLASNSPYDYALPYVVFGGPSLPGSYGQSVVRAGGGTLLGLIDGSINGEADAPAPVVSTATDRLVDTVVHRRVSEFAQGRTGMARHRAESMLASLERSMELEGRRFETAMDSLGNNMLDQAVQATELMRLGLTRCAMVAIDGGYDTHDNNTPQAEMQGAFYRTLDDLMDHLARTPGRFAEWMIDEVVVVAMSEFGRTPKFNGSLGRDHWPFTSVLTAGAGVSGNHVLGHTDGGLVGQPIDLSTGLPKDSGIMLGCENVGTALLKLGGLDPERFLPGVDPLTALIRGA